MSTIQEAQTGFTNIDYAMNIARAKYSTNPDLQSQIEPNPFVLTEDDPDFDERYGIAFAKSQSLLMQARLQLAAPCVAPRELSAGEWEDKAEADEWDYRFQRADTITDHMLIEKDNLFENVMGTICDLESDKALLLGDVDVPGPPASPKLEYIRGVPEDVRQWVRNSKQRWRENVVREAGYKPVMVVKPANPFDDEGQKKGHGVAIHRDGWQMRGDLTSTREKRKRKTIERVHRPEATEIERKPDCEHESGVDSQNVRSVETTSAATACEHTTFGQKPRWYMLASWNVNFSW